METNKTLNFENFFDNVLNNFMQINKEETINTVEQIEDSIEFKSLYEYLGKAASGELGKKVFKLAKNNKIFVKYKDVKQGGYNGKIVVYPVTFLEDYFKRRGEHQYNKQYFD